MLVGAGGAWMRDVITWFCQKNSNIMFMLCWKEQIFEFCLRRGTRPESGHSNIEKHPINGFIKTKTLTLYDLPMSCFKGKIKNSKIYLNSGLAIEQMIKNSHVLAVAILC